MKSAPMILVIEDERAIRDFLDAMLKAAGYRSLLAATGLEAVSMASSHCPELVLLDLGLPDMDGLAVLSAIRAWSAMPVIVVSARQQEEDIVHALDLGADDYVTKPFANTVLLARIRGALRKTRQRGAGQIGETQTFAGGALCIDHRRRLVHVDGAEVHLTPIEYKILSLLAFQAGGVMTHDALRRELWGPYAGDNRTLRVNMANLRRKIEKNAADPQYLLTEVGVGYRMMEADSAQDEAE